MSLEDPNKNPFVEQKLALDTKTRHEAYERTDEMLTRLEDYTRLLNGHLRDYPIPETKTARGGTIKSITFGPSPGRTTGLELSDSGTYHLRDKITSEDGMLNELSYQVTPEDKDDPRNRRGYLFFRSSSDIRDVVLDYRGQAHGTGYLTEFRGLRPTGLTEEGLHVPSQGQYDWDSKWHDFQLKLLQDGAFHDHLQALSRQKEPEEERVMARQLLRGGVTVDDAQQFIQRVKKLWEDTEAEIGSMKKRLKRFMGHDFPDKDIPVTKGKQGQVVNQRPADYIYGHQEVQETIATIEKRLREAVHGLDAKLLPDTDLPHRMSAEQIAKRNRMI